MAVKTSWAAGDVLLAADLTDTFAAKAALAGATYTGTHNFTSATVTGIPAGLSIVTPTSTANSGGSVTATGGQIVFSGVTSVSLNGCFTSTYDVYRVIMSLTHSGTANLTLRLRASGTDNSAASYDQAMIYQNLTTAYGANDQNQTSIGLSLSGAYIRRWSTMDIYQPNKAETTYWGILHGESSLAAGNAGTITGLHDSTTQFDGLSLIASTGSITGTIRVYGYKNS